MLSSNHDSPWVALTRVLPSFQMPDALHFPDRVLVDRLLAGDPEAADHFVTRFSRLVWAVLVRDVGMVHPQGDDVFQELFLRLWEDDYRRLRNWPGEGDFAGYLVPIVRHLAIDHVRGRRPERENPLPRPDEQDEPSTSEPDAEELAQLDGIANPLIALVTAMPWFLSALLYVMALWTYFVLMKLATTERLGAAATTSQ